MFEISRATTGIKSVVRGGAISRLGPKVEVRDVGAKNTLLLVKILKKTLASVSFVMLTGGKRF